MLTSTQLLDQNISEGQAELILGSMIRQVEDEKLRRRFSESLAKNYQVERSLTVQKSSGKIRKMYFIFITVAAALVLFVGGPSLIFSGGESALNRQLSSIEISMGRAAVDGDRSAQLRAELSAAFNKGDYTVATSLAKDILTQPGATAEDRLNLGVTQLLENRNLEAISTLNALERENPIYTTEANYYQGLAYLNLGRGQQARHALLKISKRSGGRFYNLAQALLEEL